MAFLLRAYIYIYFAVIDGKEELLPSNNNNVAMAEWNDLLGQVRRLSAL